MMPAAPPASNKRRRVFPRPADLSEPPPQAPSTRFAPLRPVQSSPVSLRITLPALTD
ncbi:hypothetical protein BKA81DRAFT_350026 [Phyllosticta paracitricarpa]